MFEFGKNRLFLDCDGVLADFDLGIQKITGKRPDDMTAGSMWRAAATTENFFYNLPKMLGMDQLWESTKFLMSVKTDTQIEVKLNTNGVCEFAGRVLGTSSSVGVLTGAPHGNWAPKQKHRWIDENLSYDVPRWVCWSRDKHHWALPGDILVDDKLKAKAHWEAVGGKFVHHINVEDTLAQLSALGVLP